MSNSNTTEKKQWSTKNKYKDLIPDNIIEGYELDAVIVTTFTLHQIQLHKLLYEIGAIPLIKEGKVHVFYDSSARDGKDTTESIISEKYLHGITLKDGDNIFAFHPKVLLLRYCQKNDIKIIRYVVIVSSKNISTVNLRDVYATAYGDVKEKESNKNNGKQLAEFIKYIYDKSDLKNDPFDNIDICKDLNKVKFEFGTGLSEDIKFYKSNEVWEEIKDKEGLTIISPFLSSELVEYLKDKIARIISSEQGYAKLEEKTMEELLNKAYLYKGNDGLHAKVFSWKEDSNPKYIVGSSNATNNGCNINGNSKNIEYNICFDGDDTNTAFLEVTQFKIENYRMWKTLNSSGPDFRGIFTRFMENVEISCSDKPEVKITNKNKKENPEDEYEISFALDDKYLSFTDNNPIIFTPDSLIPVIKVKIKNNKANDDDDENIRERVFLRSIYYCWPDPTELNKQCDGARVKLIEHLQKQIIEGKKNRSFFIYKGKNENSSIHKSKYVMDKVYAHEDLVKLWQSTGNIDTFKEKLVELKSITEILIKEFESDKQKKLISAINLLLEGVKDE